MKETLNDRYYRMTGVNRNLIEKMQDNPKKKRKKHLIFNSLTGF